MRIEKYKEYFELQFRLYICFEAIFNIHNQQTFEMTDGPFENTLLQLNEYEYVKKMGAFKPEFEGIPEDYYPLTCC